MKILPRTLSPAAVAIILTAVWHTYQAILVLLTSDGVKATGLLMIKIFIGFLGSKHPAATTGWLMVVSALMAYAAAILPVGPFRILMFVPQQIVLGMEVMGGVVSTLQGRYLDHTVIDRAQISADQSIYILVFALHLIVIVVRCAEHDPE